MALVLRRRCGESIQMGDIRITVTRIRDFQVSIAIDAPRSIPVHRTELLELGRRPHPHSGDDLHD